MIYAFYRQRADRNIENKIWNDIAANLNQTIFLTVISFAITAVLTELV